MESFNQHVSTRLVLMVISLTLLSTMASTKLRTEILVVCLLSFFRFHFPYVLQLNSHWHNSYDHHVEGEKLRYLRNAVSGCWRLYTPFLYAAGKNIILYAPGLWHSLSLSCTTWTFGQLDIFTIYSTHSYTGTSPCWFGKYNDHAWIAFLHVFHLRLRTRMAMKASFAMAE